MNTDILFEKIKIGSIELNNRIIMAPMTRCRAIGNVPNDLMAEYYGQRASAGLIITEGTSPSPNGLGYARIPGMFSEEQTEGWKKVTSKVHQNGGKIVVQLMHTGRISHPLNMPAGTVVMAPSAVKAAGEMWTDAQMMREYPIPKEMSEDELIQTKNEFINSAINAVKAGFDGVELHAANGYLLEQFISPITNIRNDEYGGSIENRCRFVLEVAEAVADAIGKDKVGIRISPYGVASDMPHYPEIDATYDYLTKGLDKIGLAYVHVVDHSAMGAPEVPLSIKKKIRSNFKNTIIISGGYDKERAIASLNDNLGNVVAFGRPFINNPDLVNRLQNNLELSQDLKTEMFYTADDKGYIDYPVHP